MTLTPDTNALRLPLIANVAIRVSLLGVALLVAGAWTCRVPADEKQPAAKSRDEILAARRYELMQQRVADAEVRAKEPTFPMRFATKPIFRYNDPARGYVAATVWKLGDQGRPHAIVAAELVSFDYGKPCISYEFLSLTPTPFAVSSKDIQWSPDSTQIEFKPVPDAPDTANTPQRRLPQFRDLAKRFSCQEEVKGEKAELRLLPQPVDRYIPSTGERADGAIFFFTFGTNPEVVLLIETNGTKWSYAAGRLTGAESVVLMLDKDIAWHGPPVKQGIHSPHTGSIAPIDIPGIGPDGRDLSE